MTNSPKGHLVFLIILTVLAICDYTPIAIHGVNAAENVMQNIVDPPLPPSATMTAEEYESIQSQLFSVLNNQNPKVALLQLRERMEGDNAVIRSCHLLVHEIGHEAYRKYGNFIDALKYQDTICNSGYLHGVIESHFSEVEDVFPVMKEICNQYPNRSYLSWQCYHGIGHGVMFFTSNDLPMSLDLCDAYNTKFARSTCANGVFMENFNSHQEFHPTKFLKVDDLFYPCNEQKKRYRKACYLYTPTSYLNLNVNDYAGALKWCENARRPYNYTCVQGVGGLAIKDNIANPKFVEQVCMTHKAVQADCIAGMTGLYILHYGDLEPGKRLCGGLEQSNREVCRDAVAATARRFSDW